MDNFQSAEIDQLMSVLMEIHKEFGVVINTDRRGHKAMYASLPCVLDSIHKMCSKYGLILTQASRVLNGQMVLETMLSHPKSKQWISSQSLLTPNPDISNSDQAWGGSNTYHRRYDAMTLMGIFAEDDPTDHNSDDYIKLPQSNLISEKQHALLAAKINNNNALKSKVLSLYKITKLSDLPWKEFNKVLQYVEQVKVLDH